MRDVFGTRLQRAEDAFPPVIRVAAHKGGSKPPFLFTSSGPSLKGLRVLLVEGNDPQGTAMYHGWVPDLHIHAENISALFILGKRMMPATL